jgi:polyphosphate glucokinase
MPSIAQDVNGSVWHGDSHVVVRQNAEALAETRTASSNAPADGKFFPKRATTLGILFVRARRPPKTRPTDSKVALPRESRPRTLCIDIGGTGVKALIVNSKGAQISERLRVKTPRPATPKKVLAALMPMVEELRPFERVSVGFPGVVQDGVVKTAPNLHRTWHDVDLAKVLTGKLRKPARVLNDAGIQGLGVIENKGVELVLTLGTGFGFALYVNGMYVPNLEIAHHPLRGQKTYEQTLGGPAMQDIGKAKWNKRVTRVLALIQPIFNPRKIYIGGGNVKYLTARLPRNVKCVQNIAGLIGGIALWNGQSKAALME